MIDSDLPLSEALSGRYDVDGLVGEGGMALVYGARDVKHDRRVAIKVMRPDVAGAVGVERFLSEIRLTAQLNHPHILPLYESGEADGLLYYVMPFISGPSLAARLARESPLPIGEAVQIAREVAEALGYAHGRGLVHRDIKPANILLSEGHALVADFGISRALSEAGSDRLTQTGMAMGTPAYMSPEQAAGDADVDARSDVYSLGCVLYEMLAGQIPFTAPTQRAMMARHTLEPAPSPRVMRASVSPPLADIVLRAMAKDPVDRFDDGAAMAAALGTGGSAASTPVGGGGRPLGRTLAAAGIVAVATAGWWFGLRDSGAIGGGASVLSSVAVLPFEDVSPGTGEAYFVEGLTSSLVNRFAESDRLRVAGRQSSRRFESSGFDARQVGQSLNVETVLVGDVWKTGDSVRIAARLVDTADGAERWAREFVVTVGDVFGVEDEILRAVHDELAVTAASDGREAVPTTNAMAHDKYLWGRFNLDRQTREGVMDAIDNFSMSIGFDSAYAEAYAGLADARLALLAYAPEPPAAETMAHARNATAAALRFDPGLAAARVAAGLLAVFQYNWTGAEEHYVRALELAPGNAVVRQRYADLLMIVGRLDAALLHAQVVLERDRLSPTAHHTLLRIYRARGEVDEAIRSGQQLLQVSATDATAWLDVAVLFVSAARYGDARNALERYAELVIPGADFTPFVDAVQAVARTEAPAAVSFEGFDRADPVQRAVVRQLAGDGAGALTILERAHLDRHPALGFVATRPELAELSATPRLRAILADLGLAGR